MKKSLWLRIFFASIIFIAISAAIVAAAYFVHEKSPSSNQNVAKKQLSFSEITTKNLNEKQLKLFQILRHEYETQPSGTKYSDGQTEPWCANFSSWAYREIGAPFTNPNSGSWRIPGVYTLTDYLKSVGAFHEIDSGYSPKMGIWRFTTVDFSGRT